MTHQRPDTTSLNRKQWLPVNSLYNPSNDFFKTFFESVEHTAQVANIVTLIFYKQHDCNYQFV